MVKERITKRLRKTSDISDDTERHSAKKRKLKDTECDDMYNTNSIFNQLLSTTGLKLKKGGRFNNLNCDQAVFQKTLLLVFKRHTDYPQVVDEFLDGFEEYIENRSRLHYSLLPTATTPDCDSARSESQDCIVRILLGIDILQPKLMKCLLEKLAEFSDDDESIFDHGEKVNLPKLLLGQFRWLDHIVNNKELTEKMLEIVEIVPLDIQREIITCLPEVVEDSGHGYVAKALRDLLIQNKQLTVPVLDALSNLSLFSGDLLSEVRGSVLTTLGSVDLADLPVVVKFLVQSVTSQDAVEVVTEIRENLDFSSSFAPGRSSTPCPQLAGKSSVNAKSDSRSSEMLTLDAIRSGIKLGKCVAEAWIKAINAVKLPADHKEIDIFVLLVLHSTNLKKPVESLIRNKIRNGGITEVLLQAAFASHSQILREYFPSIISLADVLLRSPEPAVLYFACAMYKNAFLSFDTYCRQEIVGNLVTHIGSGIDEEVDASLDILAELVETSLSKMSPYAIFVRGVLDYLGSLSIMQIRKLYSTLSILAFRNPSEGGLIQDDMHIVIRKQLSNSSPKYKCMGVIGAIMIIKSLAYNSNGDRNATQVDSSPLSEESYKQVINLLKLVTKNSKEMPEAAGLYMDELAAVVGKGHLDPKVEAWINENVLADFQDDFVVDLDEIKEDDHVQFELKFGLDDEGSIAVNILPLVEKSLKLKENPHEKQLQDGKVPEPICLAPHFRLLQNCEKRQQDGDLENIDALLGCPILIPKPEMYDKFSSLSQFEKDVVCETLFHSLNWFREIINAFATQTDPEMKAKVISRLQNITQIQGLLEQCLAVVPGFKPPPANFDWYDCPPPPPAAVAGDGKKKGRKAGSKKMKADKENSLDGDSDESIRDTTAMDKTALGDTQVPDKSGDQMDKVTISLSNYRQFFREIDISVFTILHMGTVTEKALDTDMNTKATKELSIQPNQLLFLLEDLVCKLSHSLISAKSARRSFLKPKESVNKNTGFSHLDQCSSKEVAVKAIKLLSALCNHLESTSGFFQTMIAENDGMIDGPGSSSSEAVTMGTCFQLLLQSLNSIFSWNGFLMEENKELLKEGFIVLMTRIKPTGATQATYQELVRSSYKYISNFIGTVPNLPTAITSLKLLIVLADKGDLDDLKEEIASTAEEFLKRDWLGPDGEREKGAKHNESLLFVIKTYLSHSKDALSAVETIATTGIPELVETDKNGYSNTFPTLTRHSFSVYYKVLFNELITSTKAIAPTKLTDTKEMKLDKLLRWSQSVRILNILINLVKAFDGRSNLGNALKFGRQFIEIFLRQGMPLLDKMFRLHREDVQNLLKSLQPSTRSLQHMGGHSKIIKDVALTNQVPLLKKCLEAFVIRVKTMLTVNNCLTAFWLGNLKNRDIRGEEILSQASVTSQESREESDDDDNGPVEEEDEESEVEMDNQSEAGSDQTKDNSDDEQSCSEIY